MSDETEEMDDELRNPEENVTDEGQEAGHSSYHPVTDDNGKLAAGVILASVMPSAA